MFQPSKWLVLCCAVLSACASHPPQATDRVEAARAHDNLHAVLWMQAALEYAATTRGAYRQATMQLDRALADPAWQALTVEEANRGAAQRPPAVIVDVDETVLDNSPYMARLIRDEAVFSDASWEQWSHERSAAPTPGADHFARYAAQRGVTVFYVTNRKLHLTEATRDNLRQRDFPLPDGIETVLARDFQVAGCSTPENARLKGCRRKHVAQNYRVILLIGDNLGDFLDDYSGTRAQRQAATAPYDAWWGERWFMLPNPMYGSWEEAIVRYENDPAKVDARAAKRAALRTQ